jgi:hypothetical protein
VLRTLSELVEVSELGVLEIELREACIKGRSVSASDKEANRRRAFNRAYQKLVRKQRIFVQGGNVFLSDPRRDEFQTAVGEG